MLAFYVIIEMGVAFVVLGIALVFASGQGLRERTLLLGFISMPVFTELFMLANVPSTLAIISAGAVVLIELLMGSVLRVAAGGRVKLKQAN